MQAPINLEGKLSFLVHYMSLALTANRSAAPQPLTGKVYTHFNTKVRISFQLLDSSKILGHILIYPD
jgi:hypothetical protein